LGRNGHGSHEQKTNFGQPLCLVEDAHIKAPQFALGNRISPTIRRKIPQVEYSLATV
jgi:hypothetical protein